MHLDALDQLAAGGAALIAGTVNSVAGGGTLVSFPALVALGVPAVNANVTNTVSLVPGYLAGSWAQRDDLRPQLVTARALAAVSAMGGLAGSILLIILPGAVFRQAVPYLILLSCLLLGFRDRLRPSGRSGVAATHDRPRLLLVSVFLSAVYGGFFGAGLGIMFLAVLGLFKSEPLTELNALKQALSFVTNIVAAVFFAASGRTVWLLVPVMAVASMIGGWGGGHLVRLIDARQLTRVVVVAGVAIAVFFWVR